MSKKVVKIITILVVLILATTIFSGCYSNKISEKSYGSYDYFGTTTNMLLMDTFSKKSVAQNANKCWQEINSTLKVLDELLSTSKEDSEISKFNAMEGGKSMEISYHTYQVLNIAKQMYEFTNGAYNPAVYWLVDLWGFTPRFSGFNYFPTQPYDRVFEEQTDQITGLKQSIYPIPTQSYINLFKQLTNFEDINLYSKDTQFYIDKPSNFIEIDNQKYYLALDLGGIAKGYAVDLVNRTINQYGFQYGFFSLGSSSISLKQFPDKINDNIELGNWSLNLTNALYSLSGYNSSIPKNYATIYAKDILVGSSGIYEKYYKIDNKIYCHIINPFDGKPIDNGIMSTTILSGNASYNDALSTAISVMGASKAMDFAISNPTYEYYDLSNNTTTQLSINYTFGWNNNNINYYWTSMDSNFEIVDKSYQSYSVSYE